MSGSERVAWKSAINQSMHELDSKTESFVLKIKVAKNNGKITFDDLTSHYMQVNGLN